MAQTVTFGEILASENLEVGTPFDHLLFIVMGSICVDRLDVTRTVRRWSRKGGAYGIFLNLEETRWEVHLQRWTAGFEIVDSCKGSSRSNPTKGLDLVLEKLRRFSPTGYREMTGLHPIVAERPLKTPLGSFEPQKGAVYGRNYQRFLGKVHIRLIQVLGGWVIEATFLKKIGVVIVRGRSLDAVFANFQRELRSTENTGTRAGHILSKWGVSEERPPWWERLE